MDVELRNSADLVLAQRAILKLEEKVPLKMLNMASLTVGCAVMEIFLCKIAKLAGV